MADPTRAHDMFARTPANRFLGTRLVARSAERVEVRMPSRPEMAQEYGVVQGGVLSGLADTAAVYLLIPEAMDRGRVHGVEFKMNFLRPALADGTDLVAVATPVKIGRSIAVCSVDITQADRLIARGTFTYLVEE
jgi:uncharacterized protein (TIGR00369 family)